MPAYEVSNHARVGQESLHNLTYWRYADYAGVGPGAHGRLTLDGKKYATRAHRAPDIWLQKVAEQGHGYHPFEASRPREPFFRMYDDGDALGGRAFPLIRIEAEAGTKLAGSILPQDKTAIRFWIMALSRWIIKGYQTDDRRVYNA